MAPNITITLSAKGAADIINTLEGEFSPGFDHWRKEPGTGPILSALLDAGYRIRGDKLIGPQEAWYDLARGWVTD